MTSLFLSALLLLGQTVSDAGTISGRITTVDKKPIRVMAVAVPESPGETGNAIMSITQTDSSGNYKLENIPEGRYYVTIGVLEIPTYYPGVAEMSAARVVTVARGASIQKIDFNQVVPTTRKVTGRVVFANSNPPKGVPGRNVRLYWNGLRYQVDAAPDGTFTFPEVMLGTYNIGVMGMPSTTTLAVNKELAEVIIPITPLNTVTGRIVVEGGGPVPRVTFTTDEAGNSVRMPVSDRTFSLSMPDGVSRLSVLPDSLPAGYTVRSLTYARRDLLKEPFENTFLKDEVVLTVRSPNVSRVTVRGRVLAQDLELKGSRVELVNPALAESRSAEVRADGTFNIPGVLPGTYTMKSTLEGATSPNIVVGTSDLRNVEIVVPTPSAASLDPEKLLGSLAWTILDGNGKVVEKGSRSIRLKDLVAWGINSKALSINNQFVLNLFDNPTEFRSEKTLFTFGVRDTSLNPLGSTMFRIDGPMHARKYSGADELDIDVSQVAGRWEVTRTEFISDVTVSWAGYAVVIQKGSVITWPSSVNGKMVAN